MGYRAGIVGVAVLLGVALAGPASAQVDFSGIWAPIMHEDSVERAAGPDIGDFLGLPINEAGRQRGETWSAEILTMEEHTCKPHPATYGFRGVGNLRITNTYDPATFALTRIDTHIQWMEQLREIWMDGRERPPDFAPHTWQGFSTGRWDGAVLVVDGGGSMATALMGDMIAASAVEHGWAGVVIHGPVRDRTALARLELGVKALGSNPRKSAKEGAGELDVPVEFGGVVFRPGAMLWADEDGVLVAR